MTDLVERGDSPETETANPDSRVAWKARAERAEAELTRLRKEVQELREAARPFVREAAEWADPPLVSNRARPRISEPGSRIGEPAKFTVGDLRRLAALTGDDNAGN